MVSKTILLGLVIIISAVLYQCYREISKPFPVPKLDINKYWGPGSQHSYNEDTSIKSKKISYSDEVINDLKQLLNRKNILHDPLEGIGFEYGFNSKKLEQIVKYWKNDYLPKWREREAYLTKFPHYTTQIQGLEIHFLHVKPDKKQIKNKKVFPLLLLHGWPGSVREFYEIIPKLISASENSDFVFEVIAPSLPGYGWSQGSSKPGFGPAQIAVVLRNLMLRLGHSKFFIQGGDWGSFIGNYISTFFPENILGYHSNMCSTNSPMSYIKQMIASFYPSLFMDQAHEEFFFPAFEYLALLIEEGGYFHIQATKPDTIGAALTDNPIGLAAYILEKFSTGTNIDYRKLPCGGLEKDFTMDTLLDNIMIYYLTNSITTSVRLYAEAMTAEHRAMKLDRVPANVPAGCARFKNDIGHRFDWQLREKFPNLIHSTYYKHGGHFAALQLPEVLYKDFIEFINKVVLTKEKLVK